MQARRAIFVLGMHRSGTSALTRVINLMGAELGANLMRPGVDNERGYWEHDRVVQIHDVLLEQLHHRWCDGIPLPDGWLDTPAAANARADLEQVIDGELAVHPLWAVKDPRLCLLLPLWLPLLRARGIEPSCVVTWRLPSEVASSLAKRDGLSPSTSLLCWLAYTLEALVHADSLCHAITSYDALLGDWRGALGQIGMELGLEWPAPSDLAVEGFLSPALRHHRGAALGAVAPVLEPLVTGTLHALRTKDLSGVEELHRRWRTLTGPVADLLRSVRHDHAQAVRQRSEVERRALHLETRALTAERRVTEAEQRCERAEDLRNAAEGWRSEAERRRDEAERRRDEAERRRDEAERRRGEAEQRRDQAESRRDVAEVRGDEAERRREQAENRRDVAEARRDEVARENGELRARLREAEERIAQLVRAQQEGQTLAEGLARRVGEIEQRAAVLKSEATQAAERALSATGEAQRAMAEAGLLRAELDGVVVSHSWRLTAPLRRLRRTVRL